MYVKGSVTLTAAVAWDAPRTTLYFGCQDTSIQWLAVTRETLARSPTHVRNVRFHKFFDSRPRALSGMTMGLPNAVLAGEALVQRSAVRFMDPDGTPTPGMNMAVLGVDSDNVIMNAHHGYVYDLLLLPHGDTTLMASGSGDETVRLWRWEQDRLVFHQSLALAEPTGDAIMSLAAWKGTLLAGKQNGMIDVWDLESYTLIRSIHAHNDDVLCLLTMDQEEGQSFVSGSANGDVCHFDSYFRCRGRLAGHRDMVQGLAMYQGHTKHAYSWLTSAPVLVTVSSDEHVRMWHYNLPRIGQADEAGQKREEVAPASSSALLQRLGELVRFKSVSQGPAMPEIDENLEDCRQAAHYIKATLMELGASHVQLLSTGEGTNPLVLGTFRGREAKRRCVFYGHYDCVPAGDGWDSSPWELRGQDGYVYGRGVSDNKGPVLAVAYAASELLHKHELEVDVVMLIEGEQETGSKSFHACLEQNKDLIGPVDTILVCNSYWLGEQQPCLTVGLRGVVQVMIQISSRRSDQHSGVHGGAAREPMMDMIKLLASLTDDDNGRVAIPGFYDDVRPVSEQEMQWLTSAAEEAPGPTTADQLRALWCTPSFTVHQLTNSGGATHSSIISKAVKATLSIRFVPDQDLDTLAPLLQQTIETRFAALHSSNELDVQLLHRADWWLGTTEGPAWHALAEAVEAEWHQKPTLIREGGSIPGIAILEKVLQAPALHLPMGQASDHAHLPNERIRLLNLEKGQAVVRRFLRSLGHV